MAQVVQSQAMQMMGARRVEELKIWNMTCDNVRQAWGKFEQKKSLLGNAMDCDKFFDKALNPAAVGLENVKRGNGWVKKYCTELAEIYKVFFVSEALLKKVFNPVEVKQGHTPKYNESTEYHINLLKNDLPYHIALHYKSNPTLVEEALRSFYESRGIMSQKGVIKRQDYDSVLILKEEDARIVISQLDQLVTIGVEFASCLVVAISQYINGVTDCRKRYRNEVTKLSKQNGNVSLPWMDGAEETGFKTFSDHLFKFASDVDTYALATAYTMMSPDKNGAIFSSLSIKSVFDLKEAARLAVTIQ